MHLHTRDMALKKIAISQHRCVIVDVSYFRLPRRILLRIAIMAQVDGVFEDFLQKEITDSKILVVGVGARGIGCELLKNLLLTGNDEF